MEAMAADLLRREHQREAMFASVRARLKANVHAQNGVFDSMREEEEALDRRVARAEREALERRDEDLRRRAERARTFKRELRETVGVQMREKEEVRSGERAEAAEIRRRADATRAAVLREAAEKKERIRRERLAMRGALERQVQERIAADTAGLSDLEQTLNRALLEEVDSDPHVHHRQ